jgi:hypothetical protein
LQCIQWLSRSKSKARVSVGVEKPGQEGLEKLAAEADVVFKFFLCSWAEVRYAFSPEGVVLSKASRNLLVDQAVLYRVSSRVCRAMPQCLIGESPEKVSCIDTIDTDH